MKAVAIPLVPAFWAHLEPVSTRGPEDWDALWHAWTWAPWLTLALAVSAALYARGVGRLWQRGGAGCGVQRWEVWAFATGWLTLVIALLSPLHPWGEVLFSAHMTQHELLMLVAAPLLVLGRPLGPWLLALPRAWSHALAHGAARPAWRRSWRWLVTPLVVWLVHAAALWVWHAPRLFEAALASEAVHDVQHVCFLGSALLFWWALFHGRRSLGNYGVATLYVFTTMLHSGLLGALLTFATRLLYPSYAHSTAAWGLSAVEDQQLGGLIMWVPAGLIYLMVGLVLVVGWLRDAERKAFSPDNEAAAAAAPGQ